MIPIKKGWLIVLATLSLCVIYTLVLLQYWEVVLQSPSIVALSLCWRGQAIVVINSCIQCVNICLSSTSSCIVEDIVLNVALCSWLCFVV